VTETRLESVLDAARSAEPAALLVDSIQAIASDELESPPGSIGQVRHCANRLVDFAKRTESPLFRCGHATKEGTVPGPRPPARVPRTGMAVRGSVQGGEAEVERMPLYGRSHPGLSTGNIRRWR